MKMDRDRRTMYIYLVSNELISAYRRFLWLVSRPYEIGSHLLRRKGRMERKVDEMPQDSTSEDSESTTENKRSATWMMSIVMLIHM
jgi:hypothetical protein